MYEQDDLQPINRNYILIAVIILIIFSLTVFGFVFREETQNNTVIVSTQPSNVIQNGTNLVKYDEDSDGDKIPNFMEEVLGLNIYSSELVECENQNNLCSTSPIIEKHNINIVLDASTSMNIIGREKDKLEEVKGAVRKTILTEFSLPFYQLAVYSFGNRGSQGNIPDNESCVSILRHKNYNNVLNTPDVINKNFLTNYLPNGKSPLAYTIDEVSKTLNPNEKNLIMVITDGVDDCSGNVGNTIYQIISKNKNVRVDLATYFANEDANLSLKEIIESNNGVFNKDPVLENFIVFSSRNFIKERWCKNQDFKKLRNCIDEKYKIANSFLNDQKNNRNLNQEEISKISVTQSIMNFHQESKVREIQEKIDIEFDNYFPKKKD